ncbi:MAG: aminotransferase class I/II-fold pyridoxal phosphate-dependent enzyme [Bacillales bacterium]|nr:aminotransferase class I/II-fold pyridoxal phosphate-dependent enzyme [Bacillales bacterium]
METLLSKNHFKITNGDKILTINNMAVKAKEKGNKVINATVGMLFDEEGKLADFESVDKIIEASSDANTRKYGPVNGGEDFKKAVLSWVFEDVDFKDNHYEVVGTMGATGALYLSMRNYCSLNQEVLVPSIRWTNYDSIISQVGARVKEYNLFNSEDNLDIESIKGCVEYSLKTYNRVYLLINDPCHNPTGYSMKKEEWKELLDYLKEKSSKGPIVLLVDIAYINYSLTSYNEILQLMVDSLTDNLMIQITFSASKTLSIYGFRGGALIGLNKKQDAIEDFKISIEDSARTVWSMASSISCRVIKESFETKEKREDLRKQLFYYRDLIKERATLFLNEAELVDLAVYPFSSGFFILIPCSNCQEVCNYLIDRYIYVVPMCGGIRISISSLTKNEIKGLAKQIKQAIKETNNL